MPLPFHESIVVALDHALQGPQPLSSRQIEALGDLVASTVIPSNHDKIAESYIRAAIQAHTPTETMSRVLSHIDSQRPKAVEEGSQDEQT